MALSHFLFSNDFRSIRIFDTTVIGRQVEFKGGIVIYIHFKSGMKSDLSPKLEAPPAIAVRSDGSHCLYVIASVLKINILDVSQGQHSWRD